MVRVARVKVSPLPRAPFLSSGSRCHVVLCVTPCTDSATGKGAPGMLGISRGKNSTSLGVR